MVKRIYAGGDCRVDLSQYKTLIDNYEVIKVKLFTTAINVNCIKTKEEIDEYEVRLVWDELRQLGKGVLQFILYYANDDSAFDDETYDQTDIKTTDFYIVSDITVEDNTATDVDVVLAEELAGDINEINGKIDNFYTKDETYTKEEVNDLITDSGGFIPDLYYDKDDIDEIVSGINESIDNIDIDVADVVKTVGQYLTKVQQNTAINNLNIAVPVENGSVITFIGSGNTTAWGDTNRVSLIGGHTYRIWLQDTNWSLDGITVQTSGYDKLQFFLYDNKDGLSASEVGKYRTSVLPTPIKMPETVKPYYDFIAPKTATISGEEVEIKQWWLRIYGRAAVGEEVKARVEDITSLIDATTDKSDKTIAQRLADGEAVRLSYTDMLENFELVESLNGKYMVINKISGKTLSEITTSADTQCKTYKIPLDNVAKIDIKQFEKNTYCGSVLFDAEDTAMYGVANKPYCLNAWKRIYVTSDMSYLLYIVPYTFMGQDVIVLYPEGYTIGTSERDKELGITTEIDRVLKDNGEVLENGIITPDGQKPPVGANMLAWAGGTLPSYSTKYIYTMMDVTGYDKIDEILAFRGNSDPYAMFLDENMVVLQHLKNPTADAVDYRYDIEIPSGAKYLVIARIYNKNLYFKISSNGIKGQVESNTLRIEALEQGGGGGDSTQSRTISLLQGNIGQNGLPVISSSHIYTTPIQGGRGFVLELNSLYELDCAHLYDDKNNLLAYNYIPDASLRTNPATSFYRRRAEDADGGISVNYFTDGYRRWYSNMTIPSGYSLVFVIRKYSAARGTQGATAVDLTPDENIIKEFTYLDDKELTSIVPDNMSLSTLNNGKKRIYQLASVGWKAEKNMPCTSTGLTAAGIFDAEKYRFGVVYSEAAQFSKYVGQHVSLYTYLTALRNSRSVMYTEHIANNNLKKTEYGFDYNNLGGYSSNFYGTVCTGLSGYVMGLPNVWISGSYKNNPTLLGLSVVQSYNVGGVENAIPPHTVVQPLDVIWYSGHCSVVEDVLLDRNGNVEYVVWAEQTTPVASVAAMSPEMFDFRVQDHKPTDGKNNGCVIYRKNDWSQLAEPSETPFIEFDWLDTKIDKLYNIKYNPDISTMYGDKPCLAVGDILWLNYNKTKEYTNIVIEKQGNNGAYSVVNTITLENNADVRVTTDATYNDINLASLNLTQGKYRAKMTSSTLQSDYTYWELIGITLTVAKNASNKFDVTFSADGGTPYMLRNELKAGYMAVSTRVKDITTAEVTAGEIANLNWPITTFNGNVQNSVFKIFVQGEYGVAVKAVDHPDNV